MKIVLVAVDAQYIHANLAVRSIAAYSAAQGGPLPEIAEFTINHRADAILAALAARQADAVLFSCYIWNISIIREVAANLRKLYPALLIGAGGPEVSYNSEDFLRANPAFNLVVQGEGEASCAALFARLAQGQGWHGSPGVASLQQGRLVQNPPPALLDINCLPFAYPDVTALAGRILYYESMRGCPFGCSFCLSSTQRGVRFKSVEKACEELALLLQARPKQVKFVDRTFNANPAHALAIWRFLQQQDNGETNFHFELAGELITDEMIDFLAGVRPGLFQFEIGVQSANEATLREVGRPHNTAKLFQRITRLRQRVSQHIHLDLIAGLPYEDFASFAESFNKVYALQPHQLQMGFLKVLHGCLMQQRAEEYGLVWRDEAPYEVLFSRWISYAQLTLLNGIAHMVETYHNSGRFAHIGGYLCGFFATPFDFYQALYEFYSRSGCEAAPLSKTGYYQLLGDFMQAHDIPVTRHAQWLCRYDLLLHEKPRALPKWVEVEGAAPYRRETLQFYGEEENITRYLPAYAGYEPKQLLRMAHIEVFPFNPETGQAQPVTLLFDYSRRDITGRAFTQEVTLPAL